MVIFVVSVSGLIWNFFIRKKFKIKINLSESFIGIHDGKYYAIIKVNLINETRSPIKTLMISTIPEYTFLNQISTLAGGPKLIQGGRIAVLPALVDLIEKEIDATKPVNIEAENNLEGNLIIDIKKSNNQIDTIEFRFLDKINKIKIDFYKLQERQL